MKQLILTLFTCFAITLAQAQVREATSGQTENRAKVPVVEQQEREVSIYPNPNNGIFTVSFDNSDARQVDIRIINVIGNEIYHEVIPGSEVHIAKTIDLNRFAKGLYYVKIETENYSSVRRVVVK